MTRVSFTRLSRERVIALVILAVALAVRVWDIRSRSLWFDEAGEFWVATARFASIPHAVKTGSGDPPLFSYLLHLWMQAGTGVAWLRGLSVVFSVLGVIGVMAVARRAGGWKAAFAGGALMALLPPDVRYAQEVGQYALMTGALAWNLVALDAFVRARTPRTALLWALSALVACYAYYGAVLVVVAMFACVVVADAVAKNVQRLRLDALAAVAALVGAIPLLLFVSDQLSRVLASTVSSAGPSPLAGGVVMAVWNWFRAVVAFQFTGWPWTAVPSAIPVLCALVLLALAARAHRRIVVWLAVAWAVTTIADALDLFPYGLRWGLVLTPLLVTSVALGVGAVSRRAIAVGALIACAGLLVGEALSLPNRTLRRDLYPHASWPWPETEDLGTVAAYWREHRTVTQATYVYYGAAPAFAYYARGGGVSANRPPTWYLDCWRDGGPGYCREDNIYFGRWLRKLTGPQRVEDVFRAFGGRPNQLWLVFSHIDGQDDADILAGVKQRGYRIDRAYQASDASTFMLTRVSE